jgi:hypothetical protein
LNVGKNFYNTIKIKDKKSIRHFARLFLPWKNREKTRKSSCKLEKNIATAPQHLRHRLSQDKLLQLILPFFTRIAFCTITGEI